LRQIARMRDHLDQRYFDTAHSIFKRRSLTSCRNSNALFHNGDAGEGRALPEAGDVASLPGRPQLVPRSAGGHRRPPGCPAAARQANAVPVRPCLPAQAISTRSFSARAHASRSASAAAETSLPERSRWHRTAPTGRCPDRAASESEVPLR
jgi:hypothetical protein